MTLATADKHGFFGYTVGDADRINERFSTIDFATPEKAADERNRLALKYGKEFCLVVCGIDEHGNLSPLDTE